MATETPIVLDVRSNNHGRIKNVHLYPARAQITRIFRLDVNVGQNQLVISSLPNVLDSDSIRVQGRGLATILGVSSSVLDKDDAARSSRLTELNLKQAKAIRSLGRATKANQAIDTRHNKK